MVATVPGPDHPARHYLPYRPARGGTGDPPQCRAGVPGHHPARAAAPDRAALAVLGILGPDRGGLRRDRHGDLPARGFLGWVRPRRRFTSVATRGDDVRS